MRVKQKLRINSAVMVFLFIAVSVVLLVTAWRVDRFLRMDVITGNVSIEVFERLALRADYMRTSNEETRQQVAASWTKVDDLLRQLETISDDPDQRQMIEALITNNNSVRDTFRSIVTNRNQAAAHAVPPAVSLAIEDQLHRKLNTLVYETGRLVSQLQNTIYIALTDALKMAGIGIAIVFLLACAITLINWATMSRAIVDRIRRLREGASLIGEGQLEHRTSLEGDDEFVELSAAFDGMAAKLGDSYRQLKSEMEERRQAEEEKVRLSEQHQLALNAANLGWWHHDPITKISRFDRRFMEIFGIEDDQMPLAELMMRLHPDDRAPLQQKFQKAQDPNDPSPYRNVYRVILADGSTRWVEAHGMAKFEGEGEARRAISVAGTVADITERKLAQDELQRSRKLLAEAEKLSHTGAWEWDISADRWAFSDEWLAIHGASNRTLAPNELLEIAHPDDRLAIHSAFEQVRNGVSPYELEHRIIRQDDGQERTVRASGQYVCDTAGAVVKVYGFVQDVTDRKQAEAALRESEARFSAVANNIPQLAWMADEHGKVFWYNQRWYDYTGTTFDEMKDWGWRKLHHPDHIERVVEKVSSSFASGEFWEDTFPLLGKDGQYRWFLSRAVPISDEQGQVRRWFGTNTDITHLRQTEEEVRRREHEFRSLVEGLPKTNIARFDDECRFLYASPGIGKKFDIPVAELIGRRPLATVIDQSFAHVLEDAIKSVLMHGNSVTFQYAYNTPNGLNHREFILIPERVEGGRVKTVLQTSYDITEMKLLEQQLRMRTEEMQTLMEVAPVAIWVAKDPQCSDIVGNRMANAFYQAQEGENVSANISPIRQFFKDGKALEPEELPMQKAASENVDIRNVNLDVLLPNGAWMSMWGSASPLRDENGLVRGCVGGFVDITDLKRAQQELQQLTAKLEERVHDRTAALEAANKELEAFSYSVSHDLRAPLRGIDGFSKLMLERYSEQMDATGRDYLTRVRNAATRMGQLIDDLLDLSRIGRTEMRCIPVSLSAMAANIADSLQQRDPERRVQFDIAPGIQVNGDPGLLRIALENLLGNAWKFTGRKESARIEIGAMDQDSEKVFYVRDNGAGFDMRYVDKLFAPFQRLHSAAEFSGTGIGLAIVQRIVARHGGRVWAVGQEDAGATVFFTLGEPS